MLQQTSWFFNQLINGLTAKILGFSLFWTKIDYMITYWRPKLRRCWPTSRTMSWSTLESFPKSAVLSLVDFPFSCVVCRIFEAPFKWTLSELNGIDSPFWWVVALPFDCIFLTDSYESNRCFFSGGKESPPSSLSDEEASIVYILFFNLEFIVFVVKGVQKTTCFWQEIFLLSWWMWRTWLWKRGTEYPFVKD